MSFKERLLEDVLLTESGHNRSCTPVAETLESLTLHVVTDGVQKTRKDPQQ